MTKEELEEKFIGKLLHCGGGTHVIEKVTLDGKTIVLGFKERDPNFVSMYFGKGYDSIYYYSDMKISEPETVISSNECTCPTLLFGHHTGCPYVRNS
ncbi:MAG: hypothetical protein KGI50_07850 [Patescibacteria group bacterium]|nr:hypothetical protein [Patescibacteria group bacterium]MDE2438913.1 hypothetical protein [Patescibacteria group bacterium]